MECPSKQFLYSFTRDPDLALEVNPEFGLHLATCGQCQRILDKLGKAESSAEIAGLLTDTSTKHVSLPNVDGYTILEFIAAGTSGAVYKACQVHSGRLVALKLVYSLTSEQRERIQTERRTLINCDHQNIVQLIDCGSVQGGGYLATRWIETSLAQVVRNSPIVDIQSAVDWIYQIAGAVSHLHSMGIIHRDLKLSNILLTEDGVPKLTDFGIAKDLSTKSTLTAPQTPLGTPGYMAPEQTGQSSDQVSIATDVYGLGAVLYHLITGRQPFIGTEAMQVISQVVHNAPIPPRKLRPEIPKDLETICLKCLEKNPSDRYATSLELADDLKRFRAGNPILAKPTTIRTWLWRSICKHQAVSALLVTLLITLLAGVAYFLHSRKLNLEQREQLAREALLDSIASASVDRLPELYAELTARFGSSLPIAKQQNSSAAERLRWLCVAPQTSEVRISPSELVDVVQGLTIQELLLLVPKLVDSYLARSEEHRFVLDNAIQDSKQGRSVARLISCRLALDVHWQPNEAGTAQTLRAIADGPIEESLLWAQLLEKANEPLLSNLLASNERLELLKAPALRNAAWYWLSQDTKQVVEFIKSIPFEAIGEIRFLSPPVRQATVEQFQTKYQEFLDQLAPTIKPKVITSRLKDLLSEGSGQMWTSRGIITSLKQDRLAELIAALAENQLSLMCIQPYWIEDQKLFCAIFDSSPEPCEVDWSVPLQVIQSQILQRRQEGWEAVSVWANDSGKPDQITVLWRKGDWKPSQLVLENIADTFSTIDDSDDENVRTQILHHHCQAEGEFREMALKTAQHCSNADDSRRRFIHLRSQYVVDGTLRLTTSKLEYYANSEEIIEIKRSEAAEHLRQQELLARMGFEPFFLLAEPKTGQLGSHWHRRKTTSDSDHRDLAKLALVGWALGDSRLVLDSLELTQFPEVRTHVIEKLFLIDPNADRLLELLHSECEPSQLYGLLMALTNFPAQAIVDKNKLQDRLQWCWLHDDSGVHFAADHVLRLMLPDLATGVVHAEHTLRFGLDSLPKGREWYYGPAGLPFVIVEKGTSSIYGFDDQIPWNVSIDRHLERIDRRFAICAVEIPQQLFERFLVEEGSAFTRHDFLNPRNGPAMGVPLDLMLRFCSWLSDMENIPDQHRGIAVRADIKAGMQITKDFWSRDGYRLPTNLEWETAFRCGTSSRHFLGDSFEYMQEYCWDSTNCDQNPRPCATRKPNPWGLFDIAGNLYEAVLGDNDHLTSPESAIWDDKSLTKDTILDIRGGSFLSSRIYSSAGSHHHIGALSGDINCGFRIARTLPEKSTTK